LKFGAAVPTIAKLEIIPLIYRLPKGRAYGMARGLTSIRQASLVKLTTDDGVEGIGEAWGPPAVTKAYLDLIASYFVGREVYGFEHATSAILSTHYHFGIQNQMTSCLSGIDIACLDAIGKMLSLPVVKLLGGPARDRLPIYASGGYFTEMSEKDFPEQLERLQVTGVKRVKIKIGAGSQSDSERVSLARKVLGDDTGIIVDANGNYTCDEALESMRRIADYGIEWYEEPLPPLDFEGYAALRARAPMPIATGEALYTAWDFKRLLDLCAVDIVQPDLSMCGGLRAGREIALLARLHHVRLSPHVWGGGVGLAAACHFVASLPDYPHSRNIVQPPLIEYDVGDNALRDTIFKEPIVVENGACVLPNRPGLGVELDPTAVRRFNEL
jgi:D-galactarolactone cycloisomerase